MTRGSARLWLVATMMVLVALASLAVRAQTSGGPASAPSPRELFARAQLLEDTNQNLNEAITLYGQVVVQAKADRALAATAELRMGVCYEKLGKPEASKTYDTLLREFADQSAVVAEARARLAALASLRPQSTPSARRINVGAGFRVVDVTADGRVALGYTLSNDLAVQDIVSGQIRVVLAASTAGLASFPVPSPDGNQVAYMWVERVANGGVVSVLRVAGTDGAMPRTVLPSNPSRPSVRPLAWAPNGTAILGSFEHPDGASDIAWISSADGAVRAVASFEAWRRPNGMRLSPDGGSIVFSALVRNGSSERHIFVVAASGPAETDVVKIAGVNTDPFWTSDGGHLVFVSDRSGGRALWSVPIQGGQAVGEPLLLQTTFTGMLVGMSRSGNLYYTQNSGGGALEFVADRRAVGTPVLQTFIGQGGMLSRDGKLIAFIRPQPENTLLVRSLDTGEERLYPHAGLGVSSPRWLHDGSGFVAFAQAEGGRPPGFYFVDVKTGIFKWLFPRDTDTQVRSSVTDVSRDDKTLYMLARTGPFEGPSNWTAIVTVDLATGEQKPIATLPEPGLARAANNQCGLVVSPDGATIAIQAWADITKHTSRLITLHLDGTGYRELYAPFFAPNTPDEMRWTPDGRSIVFTMADANNHERVMRISANGGQPEFDGLDFINLTGATTVSRLLGGPSNIDLSADGSRIAFGGATASTLELWTLENVTALLNARH